MSGQCHTYTSHYQYARPKISSTSKSRTSSILHLIAAYVMFCQPDGQESLWVDIDTMPIKSLYDIAFMYGIKVNLILLYEKLFYKSSIS